MTNLNKYSTEIFSVVSRVGNSVAAKYLQEQDGSFVINPLTNAPYIVPADYEIQAVRDRYAGIAEQSFLYAGQSANSVPPSVELLGSTTELTATSYVYAYFFNNFKHFGMDDLQRAYNGVVGDFVPAFKDAASFNLGIAANAAGLSLSEPTFGGGLYNYYQRLSNDRIDISGDLFNNPDNAESIRNGFDFRANANASDSTVTNLFEPQRPPSATLVNAVGDHGASLNPGGTISDIVTLQNRAGNPISADDLLAANPGLVFTNVQPGTVLSIPRREGANLTVYEPNVGFETTNAATGESTRVSRHADSSTTIVISATDGEDGRIYRTLAVDPAGELTHDSSYRINTFTGEQTPVAAPLPLPQLPLQPLPGGDATSDLYNQLIEAFQDAAAAAGTSPGIQVAAGPGFTGGINGAALTPTLPRTPLPNPTDASSRDAVNGADFDSDRVTAQLHAERIAVQQQLSVSASVISSIASLPDFGELSTLQQAIVLAGVSNAVVGLSNLANLGATPITGVPVDVLAGFGLYAAIESGNLGSIIHSGIQLDNVLGSSGFGISEAIGSYLGIDAIDVVPGIGLALGIIRGDPLAVLAGAVAFIPGYGQIAAAVISLLGSLLRDDDIPTVAGHSTPEWNDLGQIITVAVDDHSEGGAEYANETLVPILYHLQVELDKLKDTDGQPLFGLNPSLLPTVGYFDNPDGQQYSPSGAAFFINRTGPDGEVTTRYYDTRYNAADGSGTSLAQDYIAYALADATAPAWQINTARMQYTGLVNQAGQLQDTQAQALREQASQILRDLPDASELGQTAVVSADGTSQRINVLTFDLPPIALPAAPQPRTADADAAPNTVLVNLDSDAYLERLNWVGSNQALLGIDINGNQRIETGELLTGNLDWLDANHDGRIDARDPAFRAIRVWVDVNSDGDSRTLVTTPTGPSLRDETVSLHNAGISAIDFRGSNGPTIERTAANGTVSTQNLTEQTLTGTTLGVSYRTQAGVAGIIRTDEQADGSGQSGLLAVNTRLFDGKAEHTYGGGRASNQPTHETIEAGDSRLVGSTTNTIENSSKQTLTTFTANDSRISNGAAGSVISGQGSGQQALQVATDADVVSNAPVIAVMQGQAPLADMAAAALEPRETVVVGELTPTEPAQAVVQVQAIDAALPAPTVLSGQVAGEQTTAQVPADALQSGAAGTALAGQPAGQQASTQEATQAASNGQTFAGSTADNASSSQTSGTTTEITADDERVTSAQPSAEALLALAAQARAQQNRNNPANAQAAQPIAFIPSNPTSAAQQRQDITAELIRSADSGLFGAGGSGGGAGGGAAALMGLALGAGAAQFGVEANAAIAAASNEPGWRYAGPGITPSVPTNPNYSVGTQAAISLAQSPAPGATFEPPLAPYSYAQPATQSGADQTPAQTLVPGNSAAPVRQVGAAELATAGANGAGAGTAPNNASPATPGNPPATQATQWTSLFADSPGSGLGSLGNGAAGAGSASAASNAGNAAAGYAAGGSAANDANSGNGTTGSTSNGNGNQTGNSASPAFDAPLAITAERGFVGVEAAARPPQLQELRLLGTEDTRWVMDWAALVQGFDGLIGNSGLRLASVGNASHGSVSLQTVLDANGVSVQQVVFTPDANYHGPASFSYTVVNAQGLQATAVANLTLRAVNDAPVAQADAGSAQEDRTQFFSAAQLLANDSDADGANETSLLRISAVGQASNGQVALQTLPDGSQRIAFTPNANYNGPASFSYTVQDPAGLQSTAVVQVTVVAVNDAPELQGEQFTIAEDQGLSLAAADLLANDSDVDSATNGDVLRISAVGDAQNGTVQLLTLPDGSQQVVFTPFGDYNGLASFSYIVQDRQGESRSAIAQIAVGSVNDGPQATGERQDSLEDAVVVFTGAQLLANDSDGDGDALRISAVSQATHGTATLQTLADGSQQVVFTPDANYHGAASFKYTVQDSQGATASATAQIAITSVNDTPVAAMDTTTSAEDAPLYFNPADLLANDSDIDSATNGDVLHISSVGNATHGQVGLEAVAGGGQRVVFIPDANYHGNASFSYTAEDLAGAQSTATVQVAVTAVNDTPVALSETASSVEDAVVYINPADLLANDSDVDSATDGDVLHISAVDQPVHGQVLLETLSDGSQRIAFTPDANYNGPASFGYTVQDSQGATASATAHINIASVNDAPVAQSELLSSLEDQGLVFATADLLANDSDVDSATNGDVLRITRVGDAVHGTVQLDGSNVRFTPEANYNGPASFGYWVADQAGSETAASVSITVAAVNDAPVVVSEMLGGNEDTVLTIDPALLLANDTDIDSSSLKVASVGGAEHGTVALEAQMDGSQRIVFTPDAHYAGAARFNYTVSDGDGGSTQGTVALNLAEVNDPVVTGDDSASTLEDTVLRIAVSQLLANDSDADTANTSRNPALASDTLTITQVGNASHGTVALGIDPGTGAAQVVFTPDADYAGPASFTYTADDGRGGAASATVNLTITAVNDAPVTTGETIASKEDALLVIDPASLLANDLDIDNPQTDLRVSAVNAATHGTVVLQGDGRIAFTPETNYVGSASFNYVVSDGAGGLTSATATLTLANVNDAPNLVGETVLGTEDTVLNIASTALLANDSDIDSPQANLVISAVGNATHGTVALNGDGSVRFTPDANYNASQGLATFDYTVSDGDGGSTTAVATVNIAAVNDAPLALGEKMAPVGEDTVLTYSSASLLANDSDVDNPQASLTITAVGNASHGTVALAGDGSVVFTPEQNYNGLADFSYTVSDGVGGLTQATVALEFTAVNDAPIAANDSLDTAEDTALLVTAASLLANDSDVDNSAAELRITAVGSATNGTVALEAGNQVRFTPDTNFNGTASFAYTVSDGAGGSSTATAQVQVGAVNDAPVAMADVLAAQLEDTNLVIAASSLLGNDTDVDVATNGQVLRVGSVNAIAGQTHGTVALDGSGNVLFNPDQNYAGSVQFGYTVVDDKGGSAASTVSFVIANVNDAPVAAADLFLGKGQPALTITAGSLLANDSDPDTPYATNTLSITGVSDAQHGSAVLQGNGDVLFTPEAGFKGLAQFNYQLSDGNGGTSTGLAQVNTANVAPTVVGETLTLNEDTPTSFASSNLLKNDSDADNPSTDLYIASVGNATHGTVLLNAGNVVFTPDANYAGSAQFNYTVADGAGGETTGTANVNVVQINDAPVVVGENYVLNEDQIAYLSAGQLLANDSDVENPGGLSITSVYGANNGTVQFDGSNVTFTPTLNFNGLSGTASFNYTVSDGMGGLVAATAGIYYTPVNDAPIANLESFAGGVQNTILTFTQSFLLSNDTDVETPNSLTVTQVSGAVGGSAELTSAGVVFTPTKDFNGLSYFSYTISDPQGATAETATFFALAPQNRNPTLVDDSFSGPEDTVFHIGFNEILKNDYDLDGDTLTVSSVYDSLNGQVINRGTHIDFVPDPNFYGAAGFSYGAVDGRGGGTTARVVLTVQPVNDAPVFTNIFYDMNPDGIRTTYDGLGNSVTEAYDDPTRQNGVVYATDFDGPAAPLTFFIFQNPGAGSVTIDANTGAWQFLSNPANLHNGFAPFRAGVTDIYGAVSSVEVATYHAPTPAPEYFPPVTIDIGGDGTDLLSAASSNVFFDINGDGLRERVGWTAPTDAVLAYDGNRDGQINRIEEVSFISYLPGASSDLEALRAFDTNADNKLSASDAKWQDFGLLQDKNGNGVQDAGEFTLLDQSAVVSISLVREGSPTVNNGNIVLGTSQVELKDGTAVLASDVQFSALAWESVGKQVPLATIGPIVTSSTTIAAEILPLVPTTTVTTSELANLTVLELDKSVVASTGQVVSTSNGNTTQATEPTITVRSETASEVQVAANSSTLSTASAVTAPTMDTAAKADCVPASQAEVAQMALVLNSWSNAVTVSSTAAPLAFVPTTQGAMEIVMDVTTSMQEAANSTSPVANLSAANSSAPIAAAVG